MSRPRISDSSSTRRPMTASMIFRMMKLTTKEKTHAAATPIELDDGADRGLPYSSALAQLR